MIVNKNVGEGRGMSEDKGKIYVHRLRTGLFLASWKANKGQIIYKTKKTGWTPKSYSKFECIYNTDGCKS